MIELQGKGASGGVAMGPLYYYRSTRTVIDRHHVEDPLAEWQRYLVARDVTVRQLGELAEKAREEGGDTAALVFETHQLMVEDEDFEEAIRSAIVDQCHNASMAVCDTCNQFAAMFAAMEDPYMQARGVDMKDISRHLNDVLLGRIRGAINSPVPVILIADDLTPSDTLQMDKSKILGFVTSQGSVSSHTAILARSMALPAVVGVGDFHMTRVSGREAIIDGETGQVFLRPDKATRAAMKAKQDAIEEKKELLKRLKGQPNTTLDGHTVELVCNITSPDDLSAVKENDGGGVGLFRSEFLYLSQNDYPTEEEQFLAYREAAMQMRDKQVIIRTLDIGADKQAAYFGLEPDPNPAMGLRSLRLCLSRPMMFQTQLRAIYRASAYGKLAIMFPMVSSVWELREAKNMCRRVMAYLEQEHIPYDKKMPIGVMIETPAAALLSDRLAREADFFSLGTNDLLQYTIACDRQAGGLSRFYDPHHDAMLRAIKMVVDNAHKNRIWVGVCGELASDLNMVQTLLALGVDELSVSPNCVLQVRDIIRRTDLGKVREPLLQEIFREYE